MPGKCDECARGVPCFGSPVLRHMAERGMVRVSNIACPRENELHGEEERRDATELRAAAADPPDDDEEESGKRGRESPNDRSTEPKRAKADARVVAPCGCCVYESEADANECSICLKVGCKSQRYGTVCSDCQRAHPHEELYPGTDEHGRRLDPLNRLPLPTCKCGKVIGMMSPCFFAWAAKDPAHSPLPNPPLAK